MDDQTKKRKEPDTESALPVEKRAIRHPVTGETVQVNLDDVQGTGSSSDSTDGGGVEDEDFWNDQGGEDDDDDEVDVIEDGEDDDDDDESEDGFVDHRYDHITMRPGQVIRHAARAPPAPEPEVRTRSGRLSKKPERFVASMRIDGCIDENEYDLEELEWLDNDKEEDTASETSRDEEVKTLPGFVVADKKMQQILQDDDYHSGDDASSSEESSEESDATTSAESSGTVSTESESEQSEEESEEENSE